MSRPDPFAEATRQLEADLAAHATVKASKRYQDAQTHLSRLLADFSLTLRLSAVAFTRYPHARQWMQQANADDLLESVAAIPLLVEQGIFNSARRELRYLLEALVKFVYVDAHAHLPGVFRSGAVAVSPVPGRRGHVDPGWRVAGGAGRAVPVTLA